jgi:hypothetical protein
MTKQFKFLAIFMFATVLFTGCQKDSEPIISDTESIENDLSNDTQRSQESIDITHTYLYKGETLKVTYTLDEAEGEVLKVTGDEKRATEIFGNDEEGPQSIYFEDPSEDQTDITIRVFDTNAEMDEYLANVKQVPEDGLGIPEEGSQTSRYCYSWRWWGHGNFYFYRHIWYNSEMTGMRRTNTRYSGNHWVGSSYNDQLSSLIINKPWNYNAYVRLYQHSCYSGRTLNFYSGPGWTTVGVPDLRRYTLWRFLWWRKSWNDQVSSYRVWAW